MDDKSTSEVKFVNKSTHKLGFFGFFAITASMVMTVYEYPSFATSGFQLVFFLIIGGILWFLPVSEVGAGQDTAGSSTMSSIQYAFEVLCDTAPTSPYLNAI